MTMPRTKKHDFPNVATIEEGDELQRSESQAHQECLNAPVRMEHVLSFLFFLGGETCKCIFYPAYSSPTIRSSRRMCV